MNEVIGFLLYKPVFFYWLAVMAVLLASLVKIIIRACYNKNRAKRLAANQAEIEKAIANGEVAPPTLELPEFSPKKYEYLFSGIAFGVEALVTVLLSLYYFGVTEWTVIAKDASLYSLSTGGVYMVIQGLRKISKQGWKKIVFTVGKIAVIIGGLYRKWKEKKLTQIDVSEAGKEIAKTVTIKPGSTEDDILAMAAGILGVDINLLKMIKK